MNWNCFRHVRFRNNGIFLRVLDTNLTEWSIYIFSSFSSETLFRGLDTKFTFHIFNLDILLSHLNQRPTCFKPFLLEAQSFLFMSTALATLITVLGNVFDWVNIYWFYHIIRLFEFQNFVEALFARFNFVLPFFP